MLIIKILLSQNFNYCGEQNLLLLLAVHDTLNSPPLADYCPLAVEEHPVNSELSCPIESTPNVSLVSESLFI